MNAPSFSTYAIGFALSLLLTLAAFAIVWSAPGAHPIVPQRYGMVVIIALALAQLAVQLVCFLHLTKETAPRWKFIAFLFASFIVIVLVFGSLWIMQHLDHQMGMTPEQMDAYMIEQ